MACSAQSLTITRPVWIKGTDEQLFHEFTRVQIDKYKRVRVSVVSESNTDPSGSGNMKVEAATIYYNEEAEITTNSVTSLTTSVQGDGVAYASGWTDLSASNRFACLGARTIASTPLDTDHDRALVTLMIELQG